MSVGSLIKSAVKNRLWSTEKWSTERFHHWRVSLMSSAWCPWVCERESNKQNTKGWLYAIPKSHQDESTFIARPNEHSADRDDKWDGHSSLIHRHFARFVQLEGEVMPELWPSTEIEQWTSKQIRAAQSAGSFSRARSALTVRRELLMKTLSCSLPALPQSRQSPSICIIHEDWRRNEARSGCDEKFMPNLLCVLFTSDVRAMSAMMSAEACGGVEPDYSWLRLAHRRETSCRGWFSSLLSE